MGACRRQELHCLMFENVKDLNGALLVNVLNTKNKTDRTFTITGKYYHLIKKYIDLRPAGCRNEKFFIKYYNGKCTNQNIGINTFGNLGKIVASYMELPNPELYTGHCFRRTSATLLIDAGW
jgi:integrase